jgi:DUF1009 family protein
MTADENIGLIAGSGILPGLFAQAAKAQGLRVIAVAHEGETSRDLSASVDSLEWVKVGQLRRISTSLRKRGVRKAVMAGGISHVRAIHELRPDLGALKVIAKLRSFRDDALLRTIAGFFESEGITIVAPTDYLKDILAPLGHIAGPPLSPGQEQDVALGLEVATLLGKADTGQTVVVKGKHVLALEAIEGTDETIRRGGRLGGEGATVVKLAKPGQDERFDLPAVGITTLEVMGEVGAKALVVEANKTLLLESPRLIQIAHQSGISLVGVSRR